MYTVIIIPPPRVYHIPNYACIIRLQEESFSATLETIVFVQQSKSFSFQILCQAHLFILFLVSTTSSLCSCQQYLESKQYLSIFYTDTLSEQKYLPIYANRNLLSAKFQQYTTFLHECTYQKTSFSSNFFLYRLENNLNSHQRIELELVVFRL